MSDNKLVTVICLSFNHEKFVIEALQSVINQSYKKIELIIVDDCSQDNSVNMIKKWLLQYPEIRFLINSGNLGNTKSFNKALQFANGEFVIDLAADDVLLPNCVASQMSQFENSKYSNLGIVYGNAEIIKENGDFNSYYFPVNKLKKVIENRKTGDIYTTILSGGNSLCSVSAMIKKTVLDDLSGFDETLFYEDLDFWIRVSRKYNFDFIDEILVQKRIVSNSLGSHFYGKKEYANKLNFATYLILNKALVLNKTKEEDQALLKRVHFEIILNFKNRNYFLLVKLILFKLKISLNLSGINT